MFDWIRGRRRNRRFGEREQLLDVKLRTGQARRARLRLAGSFLVVVLGLALLWRGGEWLMDYLIYNNEAFALQQIEVKTDGLLDPAVIRRWSMVKPGQNLMALDLGRVKRDLEMQLPIQFAAVERVLPHALKLVVSERVPVARAVTSLPRPGGCAEETVFQFDMDGFVMRPLDPAWRKTPAEPGSQEPLLLEVPTSQLQWGRSVDSSQVRAALQLITAMECSPMAGLAELKTINLAVPEILQATTTQGMEVTFSLSNFEMQLRRWRLISDQYQKWGRTITWLDLSIANNLPVRSVALNGSSLPPLPQPVKHLPSRRKHV